MIQSSRAVIRRGAAGNLPNRAPRLVLIGRCSMGLWIKLVDSNGLNENANAGIPDSLRSTALAGFRRKTGQMHRKTAEGSSGKTGGLLKYPLLPEISAFLPLLRAVSA
jgi:hypothetical protein